MDVQIESSWKEALKYEFEKPYFAELVKFVKEEYAAKKIYPPATKIFNAFNMCPFNSVRVVIVGQDPYHGVGQAEGLCFSVAEGIALPPSLQNIFKEIFDDIGTAPPSHGSLERWAKQGVFLLNATLTVRAGQANSHKGKGWEAFTDAVIEILSREKEGLVFLLWGRSAQEKGKVIDRKKHLVLEAAHPSPFSAFSGFFGCKHFSRANEYLKSKGSQPIKF